jgi:hypothetical protein
LKRRCWEGDFHGKVKNNALSIKNECATPKRYIIFRLGSYLRTFAIRTLSTSRLRYVLRYNTLYDITLEILYIPYRTPSLIFLFWRAGLGGSLSVSDNLGDKTGNLVRASPLVLLAWLLLDHYLIG